MAARFRLCICLTPRLRSVIGDLPPFLSRHHGDPTVKTVLHLRSTSWYVTTLISQKNPIEIRRVNQVVGARGTGKTSFLRLLLETADISPNATEDQRVGLDRFLNGSLKHTQQLNTACVEICESRYDRVLLTVIDTPGLDFGDGHELRVERQVSGMIKYLDAQYADTMNEVYHAYLLLQSCY
jgi:hypothetical protein